MIRGERVRLGRIGIRSVCFSLARKILKADLGIEGLRPNGPWELSPGFTLGKLSIEDRPVGASVRACRELRNPQEHTYFKAIGI
jgi:hypothetical protein